MEKKRILFIVNPASGPQNEAADVFAAQVSAHIDSTVFDYEIVTTEYALHATELSKKAVDQNVEIVESLILKVKKGVLLASNFSPS